MQKVIINKCFGGYGFDPFTVQKYAEEKGIRLYWYKRDYSVNDGDLKEYMFKIPFGMIMKDDGMRIEYVALTKDVGDEYIRDWRDEDKMANEFDIEPNDVSRTDPVLISVIEKYGDQNTHCCHAPAVVEVPDGVEWMIMEYDGFETLHEKHRVFG